MSLMVLTDHRNLLYLQSAKRLNLRQASWPLFLGSFNFTLSYCPGSCNAKPDVLSLTQRKEVSLRLSSLHPASHLGY